MHKICFTVSLFHASTCFEHHVLIVRGSKLYYTKANPDLPSNEDYEQYSGNLSKAWKISLWIQFVEVCYRVYLE